MGQVGFSEVSFNFFIPQTYKSRIYHRLFKIISHCLNCAKPRDAPRTYSPVSRIEHRASVNLQVLECSKGPERVGDEGGEGKGVRGERSKKEKGKRRRDGRRIDPVWTC